MTITPVPIPSPRATPTSAPSSAYSFVNSSVVMIELTFAVNTPMIVRPVTGHVSLSTLMEQKYEGRLGCYWLRAEMVVQYVKTIQDHYKKVIKETQELKKKYTLFQKLFKDRERMTAVAKSFGITVLEK